MSPVFSTTTIPPVALLNNDASIPPVSTTAPNLTDQFGVYVAPTYQNYYQASLINSMLSAISAENYNFALAGSRPRNRYNDDFSAYLNLIMLSICRSFYTSSKPLFNTFTDSTNSPKMFEACEELASLNTTRFTALRDLLQDTMFRSLVAVAGAEAESTDNDNFRDLNTSTGGFRSAFYYKLRTHMVRNMKVPDRIFYTTDSEVTDYFKKVAIDHYLKVMYPVVQYAYLGAMNERYKTRGDYVNMRWCIFTMVSYVYEWVKVLEAQVQAAASTAPPANILNPADINNALATSRLQAIFNNIKHYMTTINTNFLPGATFSSAASGESSTKALVRSLRQLSNSVQDQSTEVARLQDETYKSQLALRNVDQNTKTIQRQYLARLIEYWIVFILIFIVAITSIVLVMSGKSDWAMLGAAVLIVVVLMYKVVLMIVNYFFSS
ncbi:hypothetical protein EBT25_16150 [bacterium]|nr:hypothetical protein [bacterium]